MASDLACNKPLKQNGTFQRNGGGFAQQDQMDWVQFGRTTYATTYEVMQSLAKAGIQSVADGETDHVGMRDRCRWMDSQVNYPDVLLKLIIAWYTLYSILFHSVLLHTYSTV